MKFDFEMQFLNGGHWWDQQFSVDQQGTNTLPCDLMCWAAHKTDVHMLAETLLQGCW